MLDPDNLQREQERWQGKHPTGRHVHLLDEVVLLIRRCRCFAAGKSASSVRARKNGNHLSPWPRNELKSWIASKTPPRIMRNA